MLIHLPSRMLGAGIDQFMSGMFAGDGTLLAPAFEIDFAGLTFIEPAGVASLANAVEYARARKHPVTFRVGQGQSPPVSYLDSLGFFKLYVGHSLNPGASLRGTTAPLQRVSHAESYHWIEAQFSAWLSRQLGCTPATLGSMHTCVKELFNNIENHSGITVGCTHMQHFPMRKEVVIVVSDFGKGIPAAIRGRFPALSDPDALHHASKPGVTSGTVRNRGVGLNLLMDFVVGTNGGSVHIHSGNGKLACRMAASGQVRKPWQAPAFYPGTMIEIRLRTDTFKPDDVERESLEW